MITNTTTYVATSEVENMSLTLPPAMLRNAAPQYPERNRKIRYTTGEVQIVITPHPDGMRHTLTNIRRKRHREHKHEEKPKRYPVDSSTPVDF